MKNLLITGGTGFIGHHLVKKLIKKNRIFLVVKKNSQNLRKVGILKKKFKVNLYPIFFKKYNELEKKITKIKIYAAINLATKYVRIHKHSNINDILDSNIIFCTLVLDLCAKIKIKKFINISTSISQMADGEKENSDNLYGASKTAFNKILEYYKKEYGYIKFYNLYIGHTFGNGDKRNKLIPVIIKSYKMNKTIKIVSKKLKINAVHVDDVTKGIDMLLNKHLIKNDYLIQSNEDIPIFKIINNLNKKLKKKIKVKWLNNKIKKNPNYKIKKLNNWKSNISLIQFLNSNIHESN